ncbi:hypothetical protein G134_1639 [Lactobacillus delbrueckii subsp. lactis CRL581]|nr:hypothetical protein G134_1639 [Lactobacillus delbrueckii subsp. lactis CRL581]
MYQKNTFLAKSQSKFQIQKQADAAAPACFKYSAKIIQP